jgi:hypothetical protein
MLQILGWRHGKFLAQPDANLSSQQLKQIADMRQSTGTASASSHNWWIRGVTC